jgi:hypothetical protein
MRSGATALGSTRDESARIEPGKWRPVVRLNQMPDKCLKRSEDEASI